MAATSEPPTSADLVERLRGEIDNWPDHEIKTRCLMADAATAIESFAAELSRLGARESALHKALRELRDVMCADMGKKANRHAARLALIAADAALAAGVEK